MPRKARLPHELSLRNHKGQAVCTYRGKVFSFGPWVPGTPANPTGYPSADALSAFQRQVGIWSQHPDAGLFVEQGAVDYMAVLWRDWLASGYAPTDQWTTDTAALLLFGTAKVPGHHRATDISTFTTADLMAWQSWLCGLKEVDRKGNPTGRQRYGRRMVMEFVGLVKRCFLWGAVVGRVNSDRAAAIKLVPGPPKDAARPPRKVPAVSEERVWATLPHLPPPVAAIVKVLRWCGARQSELTDLRVGDLVRSGVCWAGGTVPIDLDALKVWAVVKGEHKNQWRLLDRVIFLGPNAQKVLLPLLADDPNEAVFKPVVARNWCCDKKRAKRKPGSRGSRSTPKGEGGRPLNEFYSSFSLNQAVVRACERAKIAKWNPKMLRKLCSGLVQARFGREVAEAVCGHAAVGTNARHYSGHDFMAAARAMAEMG